MSDTKTLLVVVYGGRSAEHEVSCVSALNVVAAIDPRRYELQVVGITTSGSWLDATEAALAAGAAGSAALPSPDSLAQPEGIPLAGSVATGAGPTLRPELLLPRPFTPKDPFTLRDPVSSGAVEVGYDDESRRTVVFPLLHGPMGEDGTLQGLLELAGVAYCGPGVAGCAAAMDKGLAKSLLASAGLPQARHLYLPETDAGEATVETVTSELGWPVFVKPANMGSSIGITKVRQPSDFAAALEKAFRYDTAVVIEENVEGRELEIGVLGWPELRASLPGEIKPTAEFYDYDDKYVSGTAGLEVPADVGTDVAQKMAELAVLACRALRVDSMARVDFLYETAGRGLLINEVNSIPGFTPISMFPRVWEASGLSYSQLIDELVDNAWRRHERRLRFETGR
ncbi:MAG: D-alanine--D-alanine ligase family protein [Acidimicrobiales bacterium]